MTRAPREKPPAPDADRLPPHSIEAEQGVLGCVLLSPGECLSECIEKCSGPEVFYDLRHQIIYESLVQMYKGGEPIDLITLHQHLKDRSQVEAVGGLGYVASLPDMVPSAANLSFYLNIVGEKFVLRRIVQFCPEVIARIYAHEGEVDELLEWFQKEALQLADTSGHSQLAPIKEIVLQVVNQLEQNHQNSGKLPGIPTGLHDLDRMTLGLHPEDFVVIGARPSLGKTSLGLAIADHAACERRQPVGIFSLEMSAQSLVTRMLCSRGRVDAQRARQGEFEQGDFPKLTAAAGKLANAPIYIDDTAGLSVMQLRARARRMWQQYGVRLFVIDYLQLLRGHRSRYHNRTEEVTDISQGLKSLAKELGVPVIALAQLNRESEKDKRKPRMSDLREAGSVEQDADVVGLLYKTHSDEEASTACAVNLLVAKQRNGPTGEVPLTFLKQYTRFENCAKIADMPSQ